jgi:hypothetical protein
VRRGVCVSAAFFLCALAPSGIEGPGAARRHAETLSAVGPGEAGAGLATGETVAEALRRLGRARALDLSAQDIALRAVLEFTQALGRPDGVRAAGLVEAAGYQSLPFEGELPGRPAKPISRQTLQLAVGQLPPAKFQQLPVSAFEVRDRAGIRDLFPAVAQWMLPTDWAVLVRPVAGFENWVRREACVVVRLRARKPVIMGGNLLEALGVQP